MLPLLLKNSPVFSLTKDLEQIRRWLQSDHHPAQPQNTSPFPTARAYITDNQTRPVAIFDHVGAEIGGFLKLALLSAPSPIANPRGYLDVDFMNVLRPTIRAKNFRRPYQVFVFVGDSIWFHFSASLDLVLMLCQRLSDRDVIDRSPWQAVFEAGVQQT
ncbi:MAG TPA: hypothetical protein DDY20_12170 [Desulfobulbaceae bacterium]|nr:hypothetical protein [Desulfobulbaceae bacterium]